MKIQRAYKTKLRLNNAECATMRQCADVARYVYNWALADRIERYKAGNPTNLYDQKKRFTAIKDELCPWVRAVSSEIPEYAFRHLDAAYQNFFRKCKNGESSRGFPKFKSKSRSTPSFTVRYVTIEETRIKLPRIGWIRLAEHGYLPIGKYPTNAVTISEKAGEWYVSIQIEVEQQEQEGHEGIVGVDLGIKSLAVCSDGTTFDNPHTLLEYEKKMARLQKELSRRKQGSANWHKTKTKIAKLHAKIARVREHTHHDISRHITVSTLPQAVVLEDLNVEGMKHNHCLAKAASDVGMGELGRQIEYKAEWNGIEVIKADRWFPSSKTCSNCGCIKDELTLADRVFHCDDCGFEIDRDLNAARNLAALGRRTCDQRGIACGVGVP